MLCQQNMQKKYHILLNFHLHHPLIRNYPAKAKLDAMLTIRPCPQCRKPTTWEGNKWKPFCSERCRTRDLAAWSSERYRVSDKPEEEMGDGGSAEPGSEDGLDS